MDFKRRLTETGKLERKGPAVLAAGVFDKIIIYMHIYIFFFFVLRERERER